MCVDLFAAGGGVECESACDRLQELRGPLRRGRGTCGRHLRSPRRAVRPYRAQLHALLPLDAVSGLLTHGTNCPPPLSFALCATALLLPPCGVVAWTAAMLAGWLACVRACVRAHLASRASFDP